MEKKKKRKSGEVTLESKTIKCKVITPMFSFGANKDMPELRPTELKGLMRYVYRITQQDKSIKNLFNEESEIFGSTSIPSPLRLQMIAESDIMPVKKSLTLHRGYIECYDRNRKRNEIKFLSIDVDFTFNIILRLRNSTKEDTPYKAETPRKIDISWYEDMMRLSFYLSGMGKRTRRARGCVWIDEEEKTAEETIADILSLLNKVANTGQNKEKEICYIPEDKEGFYVQRGKLIEPKKMAKENRPVIQKISFGNVVHADTLEKFLRAVDQAGHDTKGENHSPQKDPTGSTSFASSIIVSIVQITDGYLPIYTYVKSVYQQRELDKDCSERLEFQRKIETEYSKISKPQQKTNGGRNMNESTVCIYHRSR